MAGPATPAFWRLKLEDWEFKVIVTHSEFEALGYTSFHLKEQILFTFQQTGRAYEPSVPKLLWVPVSVLTLTETVLGKSSLGFGFSA